MEEECKGSYLPLRVGAWWSYRVSAIGVAPSMKRQTVVRMEAVPAGFVNAGKAAFRLETRKGEGDLTVSWMIADGTRLVRYAEESYVAGTTRVNLRESWAPPRLRLDESPARLAGGTVWREQYMEHTTQAGITRTEAHLEEWVLESTAAPCAYPGRASAQCLRVTKRATSGDAGKTYLFARCIGKVREQGRDGTVEELVEFRVP